MDGPPLYHSPALPADAVLILAHGAGAGYDSEFLDVMARGIAANGITSVRFEFPYMQTIRATGRRRPPDSTPKLETTWAQVVDKVRKEFPALPIWIGGKSLGGRIASRIARRVNSRGLICLGFPFRPPKAESIPADRIEPLLDGPCPTLIVQGTRDPFGNPTDLESVTWPATTKITWIPDGDHDLKPRKKSGRSVAENWQTAVHAVTQFIRSHES